MCRLFIAQKKDYDNYDKRYSALALMDHLENQCGGHGNGYALVKNGVIIEHKKGINLCNKTIYARSKLVDYDWIIYHTRIASVGTQADTNCHPFVSSDNRSCLCMNGTEYGLSAIADGLGITDTEVIFRLVKDMDVQQATNVIINLDSVFIGVSKGIPYAIKCSGALSVWQQGNQTFHASTFPKKVKETMICPSGYVWIDGQTNEVITKKKKKNVYYYDEPRTYHFNGADHVYYPTETDKVDPWGDDFSDGYEEGYKDGKEEGYNNAIALLTGEEIAEQDAATWNEAWNSGFRAGKDYMKSMIEKGVV
jgi:hypothetical protein